MKPKPNDPAGQFRAPISKGGQDYIELWITLARREWGSLVIVPADPRGSTTEIANALADIGQRLSYGPVTAITVSALEPGSALALADLQEHLERERRNWVRMAAPVSAEAQPAAARSGEARPAPAVAVPPPEEARGAPGPSDAPEPKAAREDGAPAADSKAPPQAAPPAAGAPEPPPRDRPAGANGQTQALAVIPPARIIISIPPVVTEPLGLAAVQKADAVVLAVRMNRSRMADVGRTIRMVGRDRIAGCFLVR